MPGQRCGGASSSGGSSSAMPPPPTTPKAQVRRQRPHSKTPAKRTTPKDVKVMRQGGVGDGEDGEVQDAKGSNSNDGGGGGGVEGWQSAGPSRGDGDGSLTPRKKKKAEAAEGPSRILSMVSLSSRVAIVAREW